MKKEENLVIIVGPTGIGKTSLSIDLAKSLKGEIISADSMQIYKFMDIGTAKIKEEEKQGIPHYMIDIILPEDDFTVEDFKSESEKHIEDINKRNRFPIVVGGTGLYINSLLYKLNFTIAKPNNKYRNKLTDLAEIKGNKYIYNKLKSIDEITADKLNINDRKRIIRALEVYKETGKPISYYNKNFREKNNKFNILIYGLNIDRKILYSRINQRVDYMIENGLVEEVKRLLSMGYDESYTSMKAIGYKEIFSYLRGDLEFHDAVELLKQNSRKFAKRQMTWFRRIPEIKWLEIDKDGDSTNFKDYIVNDIQRTLNINKGEER